MNLKGVFSHVVGHSSPEAKAQRYLAVKISSTDILATAWSIVSGRVEIGPIGEGKIDTGDFKGLLTAADKAVSEALEGSHLPVVQTIYGLTPDWLNNGKIIDTGLSTLRRLCKELDLKPLGYVLLSEAIESFLKETEGAPLTAILVGLDGDSGWVTLFRAGKNLGTVPLPKEKEIAEALEDALKRFTQPEVLPARIILYDGGRDLHVVEEKIMAFPWTKQLPFLHFPRVELLSADSVVKAVAFGGGVEMGGKIDMATEIPIPATAEDLKPGPEMEEIVQKEEEHQEEVEPELEEISAEEAGFIQEGSLGKLREIRPPVEVPPLPKPSLAFLSGLGESIKKLGGRLGDLLSKVKMPKFKSLPVNPSRPNGKRLAAPVLLSVVVLAVLAGGFGVAAYFIPTATVLVRVDPKPFDKEMDMVVDNQLVEITEIGSRKGVATGRKLVGDRAHGTVTIYSTAASRVFPAGTVLTSPTGLKFTLNNETAIASGSGAAAQVTATANITAADIGDNYNLPGGALFTVGSFAPASYQAKNESAFSGGNSHEATVVAKIDQDRLLATLSGELADKAGADLASKLSVGQALLPNAVTSQISKKKFSRDIDTEADTVSLDLTIDYKGVAVSQTDLVKKFLEKYAAEIPAGYKLDTATARPEVKSTKQDKSGAVTLTAHLSARLIPEVKTAELAKSLAGQSWARAWETISALPGVTDASLEAKPRFFQEVLAKFLPWRDNGIRMDIVVN
jgi:hypothetical protein